MPKTIQFTFVLLLMAGSVNMFAANPDSLIQREIKARTTDAQISWELQGHQVFINPTCVQKNKLLLHLVGTFDNPASTSLFPSYAANRGYKSISLKYPNGKSATTACKNSTDPECFKKYRREILFGEDSSTVIDVNKVDCILNRTTKLLIYLNNTYPDQGWNAFLTQTSEINWSNVTISGHSQGGGHAAYIGKKFNANRIIMFASPNDYSTNFNRPALWLNSTGATPDSNYYAYGNLYDEIVQFSLQFQVWNALGLSNYGDSINVNRQTCPFKYSRVLYTTDTSSASRIAGNHNNVIIDDYTPKVNNQAIFEPVWKYLLGICEVSNNSSQIELEKYISVYPNPSAQQFTIQTSQIAKQIRIFDTFGKLVLLLDSPKQVINLHLKQQGMYIIEIQLSNKVFYHRVLIQ